MKKVTALIDKLAAILAYFGALLMLAVVVHVMADVVGKYVFGHPIPATLETVEYYYMVGLVFLPFAYVARGDGHIAVELFTRNLGGAGTKVVDLTVGVLSLTYGVLFAWRMGISAVEATQVGEIAESGAGAIVQWPTRWFPVAGTIVWSLALAAKLIADALRPAAASAPHVQRAESHLEA